MLRVPKRKTSKLLFLSLSVAVAVSSSYLLNQILADSVNAKPANIRVSKPVSLRHGGKSVFKQSDGRVRINNAPNTKNLRANKDETVEYTSYPTPISQKSNAAVVSWTQSGDDGAHLQVRTKDGGKWTNWTEIEATHDGKDAAEKSGQASSIILADNIDEIQVRAKLVGTDNRPSSTIDMSDSRVIGIDSSQGPDGKPSFVQSLASILSPVASAATITPDVISREDWGCPEPNTSEWPPAYASFTQVVVHHTATTQSSNSYADIRAIWQYHAKTLGWGDIGYHYLVDSQGRVFEGRLHDDAYETASDQAVIGGHVYGHNVGTVGISAIGNYEYQGLTTATRESIARLAGYVMAEYGLDPSTGADTIVGHYQLYQTSCPGENIKSQLSTIRGIADRRYDYYRPLFTQYQPLGTIHWMDLARDAYKYNPSTGTQTAGPFSAGMRIAFVQSIDANGNTYFRTATDASRNKDQAFDMTDLSEVSILPFDEPRYMTLVRSNTKENPIEYNPYATSEYPAGTTAKFVDKVYIDGLWYYRTENDSTNGLHRFFRSDVLRTSEFKPLAQRRYMRVTQDVAFVDPIKGAALPDTHPSIGEDLLFTSEINTDQPYYRLRSDGMTGVSRALPASALSDITPTTLGSPLYVRPVDSTYKYSLYDLSRTGKLLTASRHPAIEVTRMVTIEGRDFYQTAYDDDRAEPLGIPVDELSQISYEYIPMDQPRVMTLTRNAYKQIPSTGQSIDRLLRSGREIMFATKIRVGDKWYLRTEYDTGYDKDKGIELSNLR